MRCKTTGAQPSTGCPEQQKKPGFIAWLSVYQQPESNRDRQNRNLKFYMYIGEIVHVWKK